MCRKKRGIIITNVVTIKGSQHGIHEGNSCSQIRLLYARVKGVFTEEDVIVR